MTAVAASETLAPLRGPRFGWLSSVVSQRWIRRFGHNRMAMSALVLLVVLIIVAVFANVLAPYDPNSQDLLRPFAGPFSPGHVLGTDNLGRDTLSRLIVADRVALLAAGEATLAALVFGFLPGLVAGYFGRWVGALIMRVTDALQSLPALIFAIALVGALGPGLRNAMLALGVIFSPNILRVVRAAVLEAREETFVEASRSIGTSTGWILGHRIIPNIIGPLLVQTSLIAGFSLLGEASLSLLGFGVQPPRASWGSMLGQGYNFIGQQPWLVVFPGIAIGLTVLACNLVGDGLSDAIGRDLRGDR
jgi:ABC-type dipeptide/oligopeptide/nickel transport system permease subunit